MIAESIPAHVKSSKCSVKKRAGGDLARALDFLIPLLSYLERYLARGKAGPSLVAVCRR